MRGDPIPPLPADAPKPGEIFRHYKGDQYRVVLLAEHSNENEWMVVYEPMYPNPDAPYFTRPLREWREVVDLPAGGQGGEGQKVERFVKV
ncbi:DUF1653 domain-containing protein [Candidatus Kaiserbacteria bacterium]|nr:DUF1653 domain-containing protein [Candidatus Kaiserbacteria bacterium]